MLELAGNARMSVEGDLSHCKFADQLVATRDETVHLKRNTIWPRQDFVVLRLTAENIEPIYKQLTAAGLKHAILHVQIERDGVLELQAHDNFHKECTTTGPGIGRTLLEELRGMKILHSFKVWVRSTK